MSWSSVSGAGGRDVGNEGRVDHAALDVDARRGDSGADPADLRTRSAAVVDRGSGRAGADRGSAGADPPQPGVGAKSHPRRTRLSAAIIFRTHLARPAV